MESDLAALEAKISQVVAICQRLRSENDQLLTQLKSLTGERDRFAEKLDAARVRLESLVEHLPDT